MQGETTDVVDWYHYELCAEGLKALQTGVLPTTAITNYVENLHTYYAVKEFAMLSRFQLMVAKRYARSISGCHVEITNLETLQVTVGSQALSKTFLLLSEVIAQNLRNTDLLTSRDQHIYIVLPETRCDNLSSLVARVIEQVNKSVSTPIEFATQIFEIDEIESFIERLLQ